MLKKLLILVASLNCSYIVVNSQIITATPIFPTEKDSVTIVYNAAMGNKGLKGYTGDVYAHTGVITDKSTSPGDWKHAPGWGDNAAKYKLTRIGTDLYEIKLRPSIREYYGATSTEVIKKLAFVFRSGDLTKEGKTETGGDIFYDVYSAGLHISLIKPETRLLLGQMNDKVKFEFSSSENDSIALYINNVFISGNNENSLIDSITITSTDKVWIKAVAFKGTESVADSFSCMAHGTTVTETLPANVKDGINYINDNTVTFVLFAPKKEYIYLLGDFNNWDIDNNYLMKKDGDRFWFTLTGLTAKKEYIFQYLIDGTIRIADPYVDKVSDPANDKSISSNIYPGLIAYPVGKTSEIAGVIQTGQTPYAWEVTNYAPQPKEKLVIYEILIRDFTANKDIKTITDTLNYLKRLGVTAVELMPFNEFEGNNSWGYNPSFYFAADKAYGTKNDYKTFIDACHKAGLAVIQDMVLNHSYNQSPMVRMYFEGGKPSVDNPWYNQVSNMANPSAQWGNDFNHESVYTQKFVDSVCSYWLNEYKVDGFRFDFTKGFTNTPYGPSSWASEYDAKRIAILKRMANEIWKRKANAIVIFEHLSDNVEEKELANAGIMLWNNMNYGYCEASMGYVSTSNLSSVSYKAKNFNIPGLVSYMESHDEERQMFKNITHANNANSNYPIKGNLKNSLSRSELAAIFFFPIPGPKMIWQFGELGYDISINEGGRLGDKPIKWDYYYDSLRYRLYSIYAALIKLRKEEDAFSSDDFTLNASGAMKTISINSPSMDVTVVGNFSVQPTSDTIVFSKTGWWYSYFSGDSINVTDVKQKMTLGISQYRIYTSRKLAKPDVTTKDDIVDDVSTIDNSEIRVFPNPCYDKLKISLSDNLNKGYINISNIYGQLVYTTAFSSNEITLDSHDLKAGLYLIAIKSGGSFTTSKFLKVE